MKLNRKNKKGFTIVELVIVIAVIGILSAILIPTFANLTTEAQKAAKKQQVSDAYTAYLVEATDNKYDGYLFKKGDNYSSVALTQKGQDKVALKLDKEWFTYDSKEGWKNVGESNPSGLDVLVCTQFSANEESLCKEDKTVLKTVGEAEVTADKLNQELSTFNNVLVYTLA